MFLGKTFNLTTIICLLLIPMMYANAQKELPREVRKAASGPEEIISMSSTMSYNQAMDIINDLSKKYRNKIIISQYSDDAPIEVEINFQHWVDAMESILHERGLWYTVYEDYIMIHPLVAEEAAIDTKLDSAQIMFSQREVKISAVFFEANDAKLRQMGFSWSIFNAGGDSALNTASDGRSSLFEMKINEDFDFGSVMSVFRALESKQLGDVVASPQVTVMSGMEGEIQIGSDISITTQDFAGNTITSFFSTGTIITVTPKVFIYNNISFVYLELEAEKSNAQTNATGSTEIKKTNAKTSVLLLDGEETVIGGLYSHEETITREGIPFLKDLPWWFLGLRYVFGFESKNFSKKELIILLKANLLPPLDERIKMKAESEMNKRDYRKMLEELEKSVNPSRIKDDQ